MVTIASAWVQVDYRKRCNRRTVGQAIMLHLPSPLHAGHARCGAAIPRAAEVTPEGASIGQTCRRCTAAAMRDGVWR